MLTHLGQLENRSIYVIREAYRHFRNMAMLWSIGKDSTTLLWLVRKAFFGRVPFPVVHIDTGCKFPEIYQFREEYAKKWNLDLVVARNEEALTAGMSPNTGEKLACCSALKTEALRQAIARFKFQALLLGIRRDEHGIRAKERYFSPRDEQFQWDYRNQPLELWHQYRAQAEDGSHLRVHPLLHWREVDVWSYVRQENIPIVPLYFAKDGRRYRSIGCAPCCAPVPSTAATLDEIIEELLTTRTAERSGRAQDKESAYTMQKLRSLGYM
jgi:sulfate adenylyltransferase subunit 2